MTSISDMSRVLGHKDYAFYSEKQIEGEGARRARRGTEQSRRAQDEAAMALSSVRELAGRLNLGNVDVVEDVSALDGERAAAKG